MIPKSDTRASLINQDVTLLAASCRPLIAVQHRGLYCKNLQQTLRKIRIITSAYVDRQGRRSAGVEEATRPQAQSRPSHTESIRTPQQKRTPPTTNDFRNANSRQHAHTAPSSQHSRAPRPGPREPHPSDDSSFHDSTGHKHTRQRPRSEDRWLGANRRALERRPHDGADGHNPARRPTDGPPPRPNRPRRYEEDTAAAQYTRGGGSGGRPRGAVQMSSAAADEESQLSYSQRVALLRKPLLTAADKLGLSPEERARVYRALRTEIRYTRRSDTPPWPPAAAAARRPPPLRVFCYGVDDVRLYRALEAAGALGRVVVVERVADADAVWASRIKRTGKMVVIKEIAAAARNAGKPFLELPTLSPQRVMEAVEVLTGWPVPPHLTQRPQHAVARLVPLEQDCTGAAAALSRLTGGLALSEFIANRAASEPFPPALLTELDRTDVYDTSRVLLLPRNPREREAARQRPPTRPYMPYSRQRRLALQKALERSRAEAEGRVPW